MSSLENTFSSRATYQIDVALVAACIVWLAFFLVYSNTLTIAVSFHGLPGVANFFAPGLLCVVALLGYFRYGASIQLSSAFPWLGLFLIAGVFGVLLARQPPDAFDSWVGVVTEGFLLYVIVVNALRSPELVNAAVWAVIAASALMGSIVLHQFVTSNFDSNYGGFGQIGSALDRSEESDFRLAGAIGEVNRFAQVLAMALPLAMIKCVTVTNRRLRWLAAIAAILTLGGIGVTFSRGVLVGLVPVIGIAFLLGYIKPRALIISGLVAVLLVVAVPSYRERVTSLASVANLFSSSDAMRTTDGALRGRFTSVFTSLLVFADNPIVGVGPGQYPSYYQAYSTRVGGKLRPYPREAHSLIPQLLADWGLVGVIGFVGAIAAVLSSMLIRFRQLAAVGDSHQHEIAALMMALTAYAGTSLFLHFSYIRFFWLILGLAAASALARQPNRLSAAN